MGGAVYKMLKLGPGGGRTALVKAEYLPAPYPHASSYTTLLNGI